MYENGPAAVSSSYTTQPATLGATETYAAPREDAAPNSTFSASDGDYQGTLNFGLSNFWSTPLIGYGTKANTVMKTTGNRPVTFTNDNGDSGSLGECASNPEGTQDSVQRQLQHTMLPLKQADMSVRDWYNALNAQPAFNAFIMPTKNPKAGEDLFQLVVYDQNNNNITDKIYAAIAQATEQAQGQQAPQESVA